MNAEIERLTGQAWGPWLQPWSGRRLVEILGVVFVAAASLGTMMLWQAWPAISRPGPGDALTDGLLGAAGLLAGLVSLVAMMRWWSRGNALRKLGDLHLTPTRPQDWTLSHLRPLRWLLVAATLPAIAGILAANGVALAIQRLFLMQWDWALLVAASTILSAWLDTGLLLAVAVRLRSGAWLLVAGVLWLPVRAATLLALQPLIRTSRWEEFLATGLLALLAVQLLLAVALHFILPRWIRSAAEVAAQDRARTGEGT